MAEHPFVAGVIAALDRLDDAASQDEIDLILLGGTVERTVVFDPECWYCRGRGRICPCHGISGCPRRPREQCDCARTVVTAAPSGSTRGGDA